MPASSMDRGKISWLVCKIVAAYVSNNAVPASDLPAFIDRMHDAIKGFSSGDATGLTAGSRPSATEIRTSVQEEGIVSFIDGKAYKTLKRHLTAHGLHPQSYRERYGLPADYPMVAPDYARRRSALARQIGLGQPGALADRAQEKRRAA
ncbi:MucR family transcriptional regulator [Methylobacterium oryzae]|uniref:MucR family transcriptional regulator n=1 Tax=Methylobacterium oryzae TaxID=334852 RepID=A0ABU7TRK8_9HYPH